MPVIDTSKIVIRLAYPQDRQKIIQLETLAMYSLCRDVYDLELIDELTKKIPLLRFNDEIIIVAEQDCSIVGFASLLSDRKILRTLYVKPESTSQNLDSQLLCAIEQEAIKQNISTLRVTSSLPEKSFYNSQGYQEVGMCSLAKMDTLVPGVAMQKKLKVNFLRERILPYALSLITATIPNTLFLLLVL